MEVDEVLNIFYIYAYAYPLTRCLLPPPPSFSLDEEVADNEEGIDNDDNDETITNNAAPDDNAAPNKNAAPDHNAYVIMPPKTKPIPRKTAIKRESADIADEMPPPAPHVIANYSVNSNDKFLVSSFCEGSHNYVDMVVHINGVLHDGDYRVSIAMNGKSVSWQHGVQSICFTQNILKSILEATYSPSSIAPSPLTTSRRR